MESCWKDFSRTRLPTIDKPVFRLGIAGNYGIDSDDVLWAAEHGANYWVCGASYKKVLPGIRQVLAQDRESQVVALLGYGICRRQIRWSVESCLRSLKTDYLDVFKLGWLGRTSVYNRRIDDALQELKAEKKILAVGTSIHNRKRAGRLAENSGIDLFMIRYNAKHTGAETDIFPHLAKRRPAVVSYTALAWQQLIRPVRGIQMPPWPGDTERQVPPLTPELCYRFVLSSPCVHLALTGPASRLQLMKNFRAVAQGPLTPEELDWVREYGRQVKARKRLDYIK